MKKIFSFMLCAILTTFCFIPTNAYAVIQNDEGIKKEVFDTAKLPNKVFQPSSVDGSVNPSFVLPALDYYWVAESSVGFWGGTTTSSDSYTDSSCSIKKPITHIYAKSKRYIDGALDTSKTDDQYTSSHASAVCDGNGIHFTDIEAYGSHKFEQTGYQSWYPETYDT